MNRLMRILMKPNVALPAILLVLFSVQAMATPILCELGISLENRWRSQEAWSPMETISVEPGEEIETETDLGFCVVFYDRMDVGEGEDCMSGIRMELSPEGSEQKAETRYFKTRDIEKGRLSMQIKVRTDEKPCEDEPGNVCREYLLFKCWAVDKEAE